MNGHSAHAPAPITFRVLGPLEVEGSDGQPIDVCGGKPATMLTLLLLHRNAWVSTGQLIEAVWAGHDIPASAQRNLKTYVWQLRRALPEERIESRPGAYRVCVLPGELDADVAAGLSDQARRLLADGAALEAAELVESALGLWRGCPYDGLTGDATSAVDRLTELHRSLREDLADAQLALGRSADAISLLRALTDEEPWREHAWTKLMAALRRTGRRHDALAAYQRARTVLVRDLGIEPGAELTLLHQEILNDAPTRQAVARSELPCRVTGFVGRSAELAAITAAADGHAGVAVVTVDGMPGIGKTALALEVAHTLADAYPDGQFHLDLRTHRGVPVGTVEALGKVIRTVRGPGIALPEAEDELASLWRSTLRGQRILLLLDDVADSEQVRHLLPGTADSLVLVTSRARLTGLDRTGAVSLDVLPPQDASRLVRPIADAAAADRVLRWCAGHPAAIRRLTDRIRDRHPWTAARLVARLDDPAGRCHELAEVHALFDPTYHALPGPVRSFYRLLSLTPQFDVRRAARLVGAGPQEVEPMLDQLLDQHLVSEPAPGRFALHPLVRDHAHAMLLATELKSGRVELELVSPDDPRVA
jgi:DNA-binding SARP family transcriptional activator